MNNAVLKFLKDRSINFEVFIDKSDVAVSFRYQGFDIELIPINDIKTIEEFKDRVNAKLMDQLRALKDYHWNQYTAISDQLENFKGIS